MKISKSSGRVIALAVSSCAAAFYPSHARATPHTWNVESGNWTTANNWNPNSVPFIGDDAYIIEKSTDTSTLTVNFDQTSGMFGIAYNLVTIDNLDSSHGMAVLSQQANAFRTSSLNIGQHFSSLYDIEGGTAGIGTLTLFANGQLNVGSLVTLSVTDFNQQGGTVAPPEFTFAFVVTGTYTFNSGTVLSNGVITSDGTMLYNSSGGHYQGSINNNGTLIVNSTEPMGFLGNHGTIVFNTDLNCYTIGSVGTVVLPANRTLTTDPGQLSEIGGSFTQMGNFSTGQSLVTGGTWDWKSGQLTSPGFQIGYTEPGTFIMDTNGSLTIGSGTMGSDLSVGGIGAGTFIQNGGAVHLTQDLDVGGPQGGSYFLNNGLVDASATTILVGPERGLFGNFTQVNGTVNCSTLTINENAATSATYSMSGGTLSASNQITNNGTFIQSAGLVNTFQTFGTGTLLLSGTASFITNTVRASAVTLSGTAQIVSLRQASYGDRVQSVTFVPVGNAVQAKWDLGFGPLVVDYSGASPITSIRGDLLSGYAGGAWNGPGLNSSYLAMFNSNFNRTFGYAEASAVLSPSGGTFDGMVVDGTAVLIGLTYKGDANLDGKVDITDLGALASHWQQTSGAGWTDGDFNYDGKVDITDLGILASNWQVGVGASSPQSFQQALAQFELNDESVPEPAMALLIFSLPLLHRRRG